MDLTWFRSGHHPKEGCWRAMVGSGARCLRRTVERRVGRRTVGVGECTFEGDGAAHKF